MTSLSLPAVSDPAASRADATTSVRVSAAPEPCARAIAFNGCFGYLHPGGGDVGIVVCGAWGYEALCSHRASAELAGLFTRLGR